MITTNCSLYNFKCLHSAWQQFLLSVLFKLAEAVCLPGHIIKHSEMPVGLRGREVDNSTPDVWIRNNGLLRQLCSLILPDWPLV